MGGLKFRAKMILLGDQGSDPPSDLSWLCVPESYLTFLSLSSHLGMVIITYSLSLNFVTKIK